MIEPERIGHAVLKVRDLERSKRFYMDFLGLKLMAELPQFKAAFFASNRRDHHELACIEVGADAPAALARQVGLAHVAFRLPDEQRLRAAYQQFKQAGVAIAYTVNHGVTKSIYFSDPDGNGLEVYCDNPPEYVARLGAGAYTGMDKLDFAPDEPGIADVFAARARAD